MNRKRRILESYVLQRVDEGRQKVSRVNNGRGAFLFPSFSILPFLGVNSAGDSDERTESHALRLTFKSVSIISHP